MTIKEMIARQGEITKLARTENRDLTDEEIREFNDLQTKIDSAKSVSPADDKSGSVTDETVRQAAAPPKSHASPTSLPCAVHLALTLNLT